MLLPMLLVFAYQDWRWVDPSKMAIIPVFDTVKMFHAPLEVDTDSLGNFYVADVRANHIFKVSPRGEVLFSFGRKGQGPGEITTVYDLAIDKINGRVWVADQMGWRVACYDLEGRLLLHKNLSRIQPYAIACMKNGKVVIGGTGSNNLLLFSPNLEFEKAIGRDTNKPMEGAGKSGHTSRFMTMVADENRVYAAYYFEPVIACYDSEGLVWEKERPWLNKNVDPVATRLKQGGMAFDGEHYHRNLFVRDDVLYVSTAKKEQSVFAVHAQTGDFLGSRKVTDEMYMRGLCYYQGRVFSLDPIEGLLRIHRFSAGPEVTTLTKAKGYENRYIVSESEKIEDKKTKSCSESGLCTCNHGQGKKCTSDCCSG